MTPKISVPKDEPGKVKASAANQLAAEEARIRAGLTTQGLASTIITGGLGDTSKVMTSGLKLGV